MARGLNEVQFPEELQPVAMSDGRPVCLGLNEVQFPEELQHPRKTVFPRNVVPQ